MTQIVLHVLSCETIEQQVAQNFVFHDLIDIGSSLSITLTTFYSVAQTCKRVVSPGGVTVMYLPVDW